ncbi:hypothetical protein B7494_g6957 [Chlorociboria aeruginascens]|nr:hypothetical protein B7494_g6957 [Chlorociboria aeruginascens]
MADIEGRPSKIRKLEAAETQTPATVPSSTKNLNLSESNSPDESTPLALGDEGNSLTKIEIEDVNKATPPPSKSQLKKLRKKEQWDAGKDYRKVKRREKHKEKQARKAEARAEIVQKVANGELAPGILKPKKVAHGTPIQVPVALILDCGFDEYMTEKELISLGAQLTRCYADNRTNRYKSHIAITSWTGKLRNRFETVLSNNHLGWKGVRFYEQDFKGAAAELDEIMRSPSGGKLVGALAEESKPEGNSESLDTEVVPISTSEEGRRSGKSPSPACDTASSSPVRKELMENPNSVPEDSKLPTSIVSVVYLTADSPHTLDRLSPNTSYIIGGIVDKNRHKGLCYKRACEYGIATAKLPIGQYMTMQSRSVLAVNHVVEIMLKWLATGDWGKAFLSVIPKRKEATLRANKAMKIDGEVTGEDGEKLIPLSADHASGSDGNEKSMLLPADEVSGSEENQETKDEDINTLSGIE